MDDSLSDPLKNEEPSLGDPFREPPKQEGAPDLYEKIESESTALGRLLAKLPGFGGYMERSRRRQADKMLRDAISARLEETRLRLANVHQELSRDIIKAIDHAEPLGRADSRLMGLVGKIKDAPQGYSGFFDATKVDAQDLARIYDFDAQMLTYAETIEAEVNALQEAVREDGAIGDQIRILDAAVQDANATFNKRQEVLRGVS
ncbi:MAG: hypothetical protein GX579_07135 [Chloroflexi bacterium]|nr:hypothetical protein [Chloroflexota bacterium]